MLLLSFGSAFGKNTLFHNYFSPWGIYNQNQGDLDTEMFLNI